MFRCPNLVGTSIRNGNAFVMQMQKVVIIIVILFIYTYILAGTPAIYMTLYIHMYSVAFLRDLRLFFFLLCSQRTHTQTPRRRSPLATRRKNATDYRIVAIVIKLKKYIIISYRNAFVWTTRFHIIIYIGRAKPYYNISYNIQLYGMYLYLYNRSLPTRTYIGNMMYNVARTMHTIYYRLQNA